MTHIGAAPSQVRLEDLVEKSFPAGGVTELEKGSFLQRAGKSLFYWVLGATIAALVALFSYLFANSPAAAIESTSAAPVDTIAVRLIAEQRAAVFANFISGVEKVVVAIFLPLLTAILGYLFGTSESLRMTSRAPSDD